MQIETGVTSVPFVPVLRVMLVDDNPGFVEAAARFLETGSTIQIIVRLNSTLEAVAKIEDLRPDLVVLDLSMPEMNGLEATGLIKQMENPPKVILLSLRDDKEYFAAAKAAGADGFVPKSEFGDRIMETIGQLFNLPTNP